MSSAPYKGALRSKRKAELTEIAASLSIPVDAEAKKDDIESLIRTHLLTDAVQANLRHHPTYSGLYDSFEYGRANRSSVADSDNSESGTPERQLGRSPRKHGARGSARLNGLGSPSASAHAAQANAHAAAEHANLAVHQAGNALTTLVRRTSARARSSIEDLAARFRSGAVAAGQEVRDEVAEARAEASSATRAVSRRVSEGVAKVQNEAVGAFERARDWASDADHITQLVIAFEFALLFVNATPIRAVLLGAPNHPVRTAQAVAEAAKHGLKAAGHKVLQNETKAKAHTLAAKVLAYAPKFYAFVPFPAIFSRAFLHPFALFAGLTVVLPWIAAHLITFEHRTRATRAHAARTPASVLVFNVVRLVILVYLAHLVPADPAVSWFSHQASSLTGHHPAAAGHAPIPPSVVGVAAGRTSVPLSATSSSSWVPVANALSYVHHSIDVVGDVLAYGRHVNGVLGADVQILGTLLALGVSLAEQVAH
ncbi:hypothetical protein OC834_001054 [Tilletia horrida]|uniref:Uncharacterized protein n=1 Tax=Tilletia horrida TaxID=155126 RepID=A0AAN6GGQ0_9BASI|nr:hypothetical protein OC842_003091 [Tilletia horrida]KAK0536813.1 hypothetical protein OC834_001054 [Tilletia horrida]KAK0540321.1 hypothetical protein OC835_000724 [Tilletia horrida]KAK0565574.1 hypothetical protein OC844_001164 [Tilletia horrida]